MSDFIEAIDRTELAQIAQYWTEALQEIEALACETEDQLQWWGSILAGASSALKASAEERETLVRPILEAKRTVDAAFKHSDACVEAVKQLAKRKIASFHQARAEERRVGLALVAEAAQAGDAAAFGVAVQAVPSEAVMVGTAVTWVWQYTVLDVQKIPREFLVVNDAAIKAHLKAGGTVPGIAASRVPQARSTGRS